MPPPIDPEFPLSITILCYTATGVLIVILLMLVRINWRLAILAAKLGRTNRSAKLEETDALPNIVEAEPGTHFEEFLSEDPERHSLSKKEQFKAYRQWRTEKGLNWTK
jgi:hypothetical protein